MTELGGPRCLALFLPSKETDTLLLRKLAMTRLLLSTLPFLFLVGCSPHSSPVPVVDAADARRTVVVELFSSEGCSSCPPADIVLRDLARSESYGSAEIIAIEEHVDYWNYLGWADPFSSATWTARQRAYAQAMGVRGVYTPQAVIDGRVEAVGSDKEGILAAVTQAAKRPKARVQMVRQGDTLRVTISDVPQPSADADVWFTMTEEGLSTAVPRGENAGATLAHAPIARSIEKLGALRPGENQLAVQKTLPPLAEPKKSHMRAIVFVQATETKAIVGAASMRP